MAPFHSMPKISLVLAILFGFWANSAIAKEPGLTGCKPGQALAPKGFAALLARGFNLPNWNPDYDGYKPDDAFLEQLRQMGFSHVRLPVPGEELMPAFTSPEKTQFYLDVLDETIKRLSRLGFAVSVDIHPGALFQTLQEIDPDGALDLLSAAWERITHQSAAWSLKTVYFELLNEPVAPQDIWWQQAQKLVTHLNSIAKKRKLVVGPAIFQRHEALISAQPLKGEGLVYAIHYYDPFVFTHQAMTWEPDSYLAKVGQLPFPGDANSPALLKQIDKLEAQGLGDAANNLRHAYSQPWNADRIAVDLKAVGNWSRQNNVPVIINEFGALSFDVDPWARADWLRAVRDGAEANCLGWTHWDFSDGFALVNPATSLPDPFVLDALLPEAGK